jgi:hypothetical protein
VIGIHAFGVSRFDGRGEKIKRFVETSVQNKRERIANNT